MIVTIVNCVTHSASPHPLLQSALDEVKKAAAAGTIARSVEVTLLLRYPLTCLPLHSLHDRQPPALVREAGGILDMARGQRHGGRNDAARAQAGAQLATALLP